MPTFETIPPHPPSELTRRKSKALENGRFIPNPAITSHDNAFERARAHGFNELRDSRATPEKQYSPEAATFEEKLVDTPLPPEKMKELLEKMGIDAMKQNGEHATATRQAVGDLLNTLDTITEEPLPEGAQITLEGLQMTLEDMTDPGSVNVLNNVDALFTRNVIEDPSLAAIRSDPDAYTVNPDVHRYQYERAADSEEDLFGERYGQNGRWIARQHGDTTVWVPYEGTTPLQEQSQEAALPDFSDAYERRQFIDENFTKYNPEKRELFRQFIEAAIQEKTVSLNQAKLEQDNDDLRYPGTVRGLFGDVGSKEVHFLGNDIVAQAPETLHFNDINELLSLPLADVIDFLGVDKRNIPGFTETFRQ